MDDAHRDVLRLGLNAWGGPARATPAIAVLLGFAGVEEFERQREEVLDQLRTGEDVSRSDRPWVLLAVELVFISDQVGAGGDWDTTTGLEDGRTLQLIRDLQYLWRH